MQRLVTIMVVMGLVVVTVFAADSTVDNLTVNQDATIYGNLVVTQLQSSIPTNGLMLYYTFSADAANQPDSSGNNHTGIVSGATWTVNGKTNGGAYAFDGTNDYIEIPWRPTLTNFSIVTWIKTTATAGAAWQYGYNWLGIYWQLYADGRWMLQILRNYPNEYWIMTPNVVNDGTWHHVVGTRSNNTLKLYLDGMDVGVYEVQNGDITGAITSGGYNMRLGSAVQNANFYNGESDEVRLYNRVLSIDEVHALALWSPEAKVRFATDITVSGALSVPQLGDLSMGSYTNQP